MKKIQQVLSDLGIGEKNEILNVEFRTELEAFLALPEAEQTDEIDEALVVKFNDLHEIDVDPELTASKEAEAIAKAEATASKAEVEAEKIATAEALATAEAEKVAKEEARAEALAIKTKLAEIEAKDALTEQNKIDLLENKQYLDYSEIRKLGIDPEKAGVYIEVMGYKLKKRYFMLEYAVKSKPIMKG